MPFWNWNATPERKDESCTDVDPMPSELDLVGKTISKVEYVMDGGNDATKLTFTDGTEWIFLNAIEDDEDEEWDDDWEYDDDD